MPDVDIDALIRRRRSRKGWLIPLIAVVVVGAGVGTYLLLQQDEPEVVVEPERVEATGGRLSTTVDLSGSAVAERSTDLSFETSGAIASVTVVKGQAVQAGTTLAMLDDTDAQLRIETAEVQLRLARLRLEALLATPAGSDIASARQAIEVAESQVTSAKQALERLSEPPSASDLASAEQSVASALAQLSSAEETLAQLSEPPSASDIASAEQSVASALAQLSRAEEDVADLLADPTETEIASAKSAVTQAQAQLLSAVSEANHSWVALGEAWDEYCDEYGQFIVAEVTCAGRLPLEDEELLEPLSDEEVEALHQTLEGRSDHYQRLANALIGANLTYILAEAAKETAVTDLSTAENRQADLVVPASSEDVRQAALAVEAARASHIAAVARLDDLLEEPAVQDFYQAQQTVEAARASHIAAVARLDELRSPPDERDVEQAHASLETARASLASAQARYDELLAGATANAVAQQEENVRLAEISLEEARSALADLAVVAPFDGIVEAVNVHVGDRVTQNVVAFSLNTPDRMLIELSVTEADLLALEVGQTGLASFDAVEGVEYPVRIASVSRIPNAAQGVVTYGVEAVILTGADIAEAAGQLAVLSGQELAPGIGGAPEAAGGGGFDRARAGGLLAGIELPDGVTFRDVAQAMTSGQPLPEGMTLPDDFEIPAQMLERLGSGGVGIAGRQDADEGVVLPSRVLPVPGMSASVTILTEVRDQSVLVPVAAVRQLDGAFFVNVRAVSGGGEDPVFDRVKVEVGHSDGVNVEITGGLEAGTVVLIGADSAGVTFSATQQAQQAGFGIGGGLGGRSDGGFGGGPGQGGGGGQ